MKAGIEKAREVLKDIFGFLDLRPGQAEIIETVLAGDDAFVVMPTGSGKSLCYQLPALVRGSLTVVVSPLIALMRNQVQQLRAAGVEAAALNSASSPDETARTIEQLRGRELRLLYLAPERLSKPDTQALLMDAGISLLAIDEAHCVSEWGHDFRPDYLALGAIRRALGGPQLLALTATADARTRQDIIEKLFDSSPRLFVRSFDRPNLRLAMEAKRDGIEQLMEFLEPRRRESGIVYCGTRKHTEEVALALGVRGIRTLPYHAGLSSDLRARHQDIFLREDGVVITATVAFGMGIDKPDVRFVAHADMPRNIESYYQEIGRAGRDGLHAGTLTLYGLEDMRKRRGQIDMSGLPPERKLVERQRFNALVALCEAPRCRRQTLLAYFGEQSGPCGHCDLCEAGTELVDGTIEAQKFMSAMVRTGQRFATEHLIAILTGKETEAVLRYSHEKLPTFGVGREHRVNAWRSIARQLYAAGLINLDFAEHGRWLVTEQGRQVLKGGARVEIRRASMGRRKRGARKLDTLEKGVLSSSDEAVYLVLKQLRSQLARSEQVPAYVVFPDRTLIEMARLRPATLEALRAVTGVGAAKLARYGETFLKSIRAARIGNNAP